MRPLVIPVQDKYIVECYHAQHHCICLEILPLIKLNFLSISYLWYVCDIVCNFLILKSHTLSVLSVHGFSCHHYEDDTQPMMSSPLSEIQLAAQISACLAEISQWTSAQHLVLGFSYFVARHLPSTLILPIVYVCISSSTYFMKLMYWHDSCCFGVVSKRLASCVG